jgi:protoporphyrinogen IX oxidase
MTAATAKALHIIGFTCWFAGLFYLVRLFVYNREARDAGDTTMTKAFDVMQRRLFYGITCPVMVMTLVFGVWLMSLTTEHFTVVGTWLYAKLTLVSLLIGYTLWCGRIHKQLVANTCSWTSAGLRILNEAATVFLVFIVFIAVFKHAFTVTTALGIGLGLVCILVPGFALFGRHRRRVPNQHTPPAGQNTPEVTGQNMAIAQHPRDANQARRRKV